MHRTMPTPWITTCESAAVHQNERTQSSFSRDKLFFVEEVPTPTAENYSGGARECKRKIKKTQRNVIDNDVLYHCTSKDCVSVCARVSRVLLKISRVGFENEKSTARILSDLQSSAKRMARLQSAPQCYSKIDLGGSATIDLVELPCEFGDTP